MAEAEGAASVEETDDMPIDEKEAEERNSKTPPNSKPASPPPDDSDDDDEDLDFEFEIKEEKTEGKEEKKETKPSEKPSEKKEEEKPKPSEKTEAKKEPEEKEKKPEEEKPKAEEKPKPKLVKVKIGEEEHEIPEKVADHWDKVSERVKQILASQKQLRDGLFGGFDPRNPKPGQLSSTLLDLLTANCNGNREQAYEQLLGEYSSVIKREIDFRELPEADRKRIAAEEKAQRLEQELEQHREAQKKAEEDRKFASRVERLTQVILGSMKDLEIPITDENRAIYDTAMEDLDRLCRTSKNPVTAEQVKSLVQHAKDEQEKRIQGSKQGYEESAKGLTDEEFLSRHPDLVERARRLDLAREKAARSGRASTPGEKPAETRTDSSPRTKKKVLDSATWAKMFR